jgi:hypothetical protein
VEGLGTSAERPFLSPRSLRNENDCLNPRLVLVGGETARFSRHTLVGSGLTIFPSASYMTGFASWFRIAPFAQDGRLARICLADNEDAKLGTLAANSCCI